MRAFRIIVVSLLLALMLAPLPALAQAPLERPGPVTPAGSEGVVTIESATITGATLSADSGAGALQTGADRLTVLQAWDGGWGWYLNPPAAPTASPLNTMGPIGMGLGKAYESTKDPEHRAALVAVGGKLLLKTNNFSPSDGYLAAELDKVLGGSAYVAHVMTYYYGPLAAGEYDMGGADTNYDTAEYVAYLRALRTGQNVNVAAWELGRGLVSAKAAGVSGSELDIWIAATEAEINELDGSAWYDVLGLAGALGGLAYAGVTDFNPSAGAHQAAESMADLATILAGYQLDSGGFSWSSLYLGEGQNNEALQETAYAILALDAFDRAAYIEPIRMAADYLVRAQLSTGGWENALNDGENNEVTGEALWGIATVAPVIWVDAPDGTDALGKAEVGVKLDPRGFEVFGFQFTLNYDPTLVSASPADVAPGAFFEGMDQVDTATPDAGDYTWLVQQPAAGKLQVWVTLVDDAADAVPGISLDGSELVKVTFTAVDGSACGSSSDLTLSNEILTEKNDGAAIPAATMGDSVKAYELVPVSGQVELQGRASNNWDGVAVSLDGTDNGGFDYAVTTGTDGTWTKDVACGTYDVDVIMGGYLDKWRDGVVTAAGSLDAGKLLGGNADEQEAILDVVELDDVVAIARVIGTGVDGTAWYADPFYPDINADSTINILDLVLAGINYTEVATSF